MCVCVCVCTQFYKNFKNNFQLQDFTLYTFCKAKQAHLWKEKDHKSVFKHDSQFVFMCYSSVFYTNSLKRSNLRGHNLGLQTWKIQKKKKKTWKIYKFAFILHPTKPINQREKKPNFYFSIILGPIPMYSKILQFIITRGLANPKRKKNFTIFTITLDLAERRRKKKGGNF